MHRGMPSRTVIAVDKSMLAANMYRLLFEPIGVSVINAQSLNDLKEALARSRSVDLVVINSNVLAGVLERAVEMMKGDERLAGVPKIFLCRDVELDRGWDGELSVLPKTEAVARPFHPDQFVTHVKKLLAIEE